jgi:hypothetical protein
MIGQTQNHEENAKIAESVSNNGNYQVQSLTYNPLTGFIHAGGLDSDGYYENATKLVNVDKLTEHKKLVGAGGAGLATNEILTQNYQTIIEEAKLQKAKIDANPGRNPATILGKFVGAAASGANLIQTAYESVRQVNYLSGVVGQQYQLEDYNAWKAFNERRVSVLNVVGFRKSSSLLQGMQEIGDHTTPPPVQQTFASYNKSLYADTFRFEFGMREKKDSVFDIQAELTKEIPGAMIRMKDLTKEIPGAMIRMKDSKAYTILNAASDDGAYGTDWDDKGSTAGFYDADAVADVETDESNLNAYGADALIMLAPRAVIRAYDRNAGEVGVASTTFTPDSQVPTSRRSGVLRGNTAVTYYTNENMTASTYTITAKQSYGDFLKGNVVNVSYKNQMSPAQTEGRIVFDFNGFVTKDTSAIRRHTGVLN